jgi:heme exporter protein D
MAGLSDFLSMGGHAAFIWPAYGIVALVLVGLLIAGQRFQRNTEAELSALSPRSRRRSQSSTEDTADEA